MTLKNQLGADMADAFLCTDEFAETIAYTPHGGSLVTLPAQVERFPLKTIEHATGRQIPTKVVEVVLANHATLGVTAVKERFDTVALKYHLDDPADTTFMVAKILKQDDGLWHLECWG